MAGSAVEAPAWRVSGTYFESCNCDAICPCRTTAEHQGGQATHDVCEGALSWWIKSGQYGEIELDGLTAVMIVHYIDKPVWTPWEVALLVDERAPADAQAALADIFLGRVGGTPMANYTGAIGKVRSVRPAAIRVDHRRGHERIEVESVVRVEAADAASDDGAVLCGIPGLNQPGTEVNAALLEVDEAGLAFRYTGVCGFTTKFDYRSG